MPRIRFTYANVVATLALVLAMSGGALAASHYLITSTRQISPRVLKKLTAGPAFAANNYNGYLTTDPADAAPHSIVTLPIPQAGSYVVTGKVSATVLATGSGQARAECVLVAHTTSGGADTDTGYSYLGTYGDEQILTLALTHKFSGPGTVNLSCDQNGLFSGGSTMRFDRARIIATPVSTVTDTAVTS
jgi:hypothetical protein